MGIQPERSARSLENGLLLRDLYAQMLQARLVDRLAWTAYQQGLLGYVASCRGHEAAQVGSAACIQVGQDFTLPYYRDLGVVLTIGMTPAEVFRTYAQALPARLDLSRPVASLPEGEGLPAASPLVPVSHWGYHKHNLVTGPAPVATQIMHAAGIAFACKLRKASAVTIAYCGDGATAEPDFREGLTFAALHQLPALFICEQDSQPVSASTLSTLQLPAGLTYRRVAGEDVLQVYLATHEALELARVGQGPILLELTVTRALPTAPPTEPDCDPLLRCRQLLEAAGTWEEDRACALEERLSQELSRTLEDVLREHHP